MFIQFFFPRPYLMFMINYLIFPGRSLGILVNDFFFFVVIIMNYIIYYNMKFDITVSITL